MSISTDWPLSSLVAECRAQARQTLDPGFTRFMNRAAETLEVQADTIEALQEQVRALEAQLATKTSEDANAKLWRERALGTWHPGDEA